MDEFEHLKIQLEEIKRATRNFSNNMIIGYGGFGKVYQGEVSHSKGRSMVAIKRLDCESKQGDLEFRKEIMMLSRYTHTNLISLLGFCDEDGEKILVYEHASNGSLDRHLRSGSLTWAQCFNICLDAAKGLAYLHDHKGTQQRVLHRDIKSANILLDQNWNAKLSDMGLSKLGPANQPHTAVFTRVVGTRGYWDPQYMRTGILTKESDLYSFGIVLLEVLCGRLCFDRSQNLVPTWKESYKHEKLNEITFKDVTIPIDMISLETFADIAFQCVQESREQRPDISLVVKKIETTLKFQERYEIKLSKKYDDGISEVMETLPNYSKTSVLEPECYTKKQLMEYDDKISKAVETPPNYSKRSLFILIVLSFVPGTSIFIGTALGAVIALTYGSREFDTDLVAFALEGSTFFQIIAQLGMKIMRKPINGYLDHQTLPHLSFFLCLSLISCFFHMYVLW